MLPRLRIVAVSMQRLEVRHACMAAVAFLALAVLATFPLKTDPASERLARVLGDTLHHEIGWNVGISREGL